MSPNPVFVKDSLFPGLVLLALVGGSLGVSLAGGFVWDDAPLIVHNELVRDPAQIPKLLTSSFWDTGDSHDRFRSFFRPLVSLSYAVDHAIWGLEPFGFHLTNLFLHWLCCWLIFRIARNEGLEPHWALAGSALFAVHPVHVESVAWICGRTDVLCAALMLGAYLLERKRRTLAAHGSGLRVAAAALFLAALFAKEMAATLPVLVFLDRWLSARRGRLDVAISAAWPYVAVVVVYLGVRSLVLHGGQTLEHLSLISWVATAIFVVARYVVLLLLPVGLDAHYPYPPFEHPWTATGLVALALLSMVVFSAVALRRRSPRGFFWLSWIFVALAPVMLFGRFGDVVMADRFLYIPSVGLALLFARGLAFVEPALSQRRRRLAWLPIAGILVVLGAASWNRSQIWNSDYTLFSDMLKTSPQSALVRTNFGLTLYARDEFAAAIEQFRIAIALTPSYAMAHNNLAAALERTGRHEEAIGAYREALKYAPGMPEAERNLAHLLVARGHRGEGLSRIDRLVKEHPRSPMVLFGAADAYYLVGRVEEAKRQLERLREIDPAHAQTHFLLGRIHHEEGRNADAVASLERFLELWPAEDEIAASARRLIDLSRADDAVEPVR